MKKLAIALLIVSVITSCGLPKALKVTENEDKGVKEVLGFYGGYCKYSIGILASTETKTKKYFELELSGSSVVNKYWQTPEMSASNIAYLFYRNLKGEEERKYNEIRTVLVFSNGEKVEFSYPVSELQLVTRRMLLADKVVALLRKQDYEGLASILNDSSPFATYKKAELISQVKAAEQRFGNVTEGFRSFGFKIGDRKDGMQLLHMSGVVLRDKENSEFSIYANLHSDKEEVFLLQYKF